MWRRTRSGLAFNPYHRIDPNGNVTAELAFPKEMMGYCRLVLGGRYVLENYSLSSPLRDGLYEELYPALLAAGGPRAFQTVAEARIGDWRATLSYAVDAGAASVELTAATPTTTVSSCGVRPGTSGQRRSYLTCPLGIVSARLPKGGQDGRRQMPLGHGREH